MTYTCRKCGEEKEACLFTPSQIELAIPAGPLCRKCISEANGTSKFGAVKENKRRAVEVATKTLVAYEKIFDRTFYAKKEVESLEVKALVEARKRRLENERRA